MEQLDALVLDVVLEPKPVVLLHGAQGTGKTALVQRFVHTNGQALPGGVETQYSHNLLNFSSVTFRSIDPTKRSLFIIEEAQRLDASRLAAILAQLATWSEVSTLLISGNRLPNMPRGTSEIQLGSLDRKEWDSLITSHLDTLDIDTAARFFQLAEGHPAMLSLAASSVRDGFRSMRDLLQQLEPFEEPGILDPNGFPLTPEVSLPEPIIHVCTHLEAKLFDAVSRNPDLMYTISPRNFELLVAELLHRLGYEIEVTPPSKDGGVDIYAAKSSELGHFMLLVECKRYARSKPVKVDVVRALHGNVHAKRATSGVVVTTSTFTRGARDFQRELRHQLELRDYLNLRDWLSKVRPR